MRKIKKDKPEVIVRLQHKEIAGLMESNHNLKDEIKTWEKDVEHYKQRYNDIAEEHNKAKRQIWHMTVVESDLLDHIQKLEDMYKVPIEFRVKLND